jgi:hypothetical protein
MALASQFARSKDEAVQVVKASDYALTGNSTSFTIKAPAAGIAYVGEADIPGDFKVSVNGRAVPYFTANYAFKAIVLPGPGTFRVTFSYWPTHLTLFLVAAAAGAVLWTGAMAFFWLHLHREAGSFSAQHNGAAA